MKFLKDRSKGYLGSSKDNTNRHIDAFTDGDKIFIVYDLYSEDEYVVSEYITKVQDNPDDYLWTPFIEFVHIENHK
jgi:hypothetical protein